MTTASRKTREVPALKVRQWLLGWNDIKFDPDEMRPQPDPHFYLLALPAAELRILSGIHHRTVAGGRARSEDTGIQRRHEPERSKDIGEFVEFGYPWSELPEHKRRLPEYANLKKPGWLPTAIVVNIIPAGEKRNGRSVAEEDLVEVVDEEPGTPKIRLPSASAWKPRELPPIEVIDGQHRLWAFGDAPPEGQFDLPVVAFNGLGLSWQAYLFWTINIRPKRINASLAYDLFPMLRAEDWLDRPGEIFVYREARAQELTEALWSHPKSPWFQYINMLGEKGAEGATQSAWVRGLLSTCFRTRKTKRDAVGGLFATRLGPQDAVLPWTRAQQAAFLIACWENLRSAVAEVESPWTAALRGKPGKGGKKDPAFYGNESFIPTDQGVRGYLFVTNDLTFLEATRLSLFSWKGDEDESAVSEKTVTKALTGLTNHALGEWLVSIAESAAKFDWRLASAPDVSEPERITKLTFKGGGGYKELRRELLLQLSRGPSDVAKPSKILLKRLETNDD